MTNGPTSTTKISELKNVATGVEDNSRLVLDQDTGSGVFQTQQVKWETVKEEFKEDFSSLQSTGVFTGGEITQVSPTTFNVAAGTGQIVDHVLETITPISWNAVSDVTPTDLLTANEQYTYIYANNLGAVAQQNKPFTILDYGDKIPLGYITHTVTNPALPPTSKIITSVSNAYRKALSQTIEYGFEANVDTQIIITKPFRLIAGSDSDLRIGLEIVNSLIGGEIQLVGSGATLFSGVTPNHIDIFATTKFDEVYLGYIKSGGDPIISYDNTGNLNPEKYNPSSGDLVDVGSEFWTIQRLYYYPANDIPLVLYGREIYESRNTALMNIEKETTEDLEIFSKFLKPTVFMGYLIVRTDCLDLTDTDLAQFIPSLETRGARYTDNVNCGITKGGMVSDIGDTEIEWTAGQVYSICLGKTEDFPYDSKVLSGDGIHYVFWEDGSGVITSFTKPSLPKVLLARVGVQNGDIVELFQENVLTTDFTQVKNSLDRNFGLAVTEGMLVEPDTDVTYGLDMKMSQGSYDINLRTKHDTGTIETRTTPFVRYFHVSSAWSGDTNNEIDTNNYDNGTNRVPIIGVNSWCVGIVGYQHDEENDIDKLSWLYPTVVHANQTQAEIYAAQLGNGDIPIPNVPPGLANSPLLMAYVFKNADTTLANPSTNPNRWVDLRPRVGNFLGGGGGEVIAVDGEQIYFVAKHGNDSNNGKSWEEAFETLPAATAAVVAQTPSSTNIFAIVGYDAGIYSDNTTIPEWTKVYMPNATLDADLAVSANSWITFRELDECKITTTATSGRAYINAEILNVAASQIGLDIPNINCSVNANFARMDVYGNGIGVRSDKATFTNLSIGQLILREANSVGIEAQSGDLNFHCDNIFNAAGATGTTGVLASGTGKVFLFLTGTNTADTPWSETGSGTIKYISPANGINILTDIFAGNITSDAKVEALTSVGSPLIVTDKIDRAGGTLAIRDLGEQVSISGLNYPIADGSSGQLVTTNGAGTLSLQSLPSATSYGIRNRVSSDYTNTLSGTTAIPYDDTIVQNTEGTEMTTVTITPNSTSNFLLVEAQLMLTSNPGGVFMTIAIFRAIGGAPEASALFAIGTWINNANGPHVLTLSREIAISSTSSHVFSVRFGSNAGSTAYLNGNGRRYGGIANSFIRVEERVPI